MILRKPYAFLIKFFKLIHILLFIMCGYLLFKLRAIYVFFQDYVKTDTYTYIENIASEYIGLPMFVIAILILISGISILFLMKEKEKPVLFYRVLVIYSFILLVSLIVYNNFYTSLEFQLYDRAVISIYRDVIGIIYYIMYFFIAFTFVRGFGFDIKKFSFDRDLKVLNISETDNEEFELLVNVDKENIANAIRREKRFTIYFLKENALTLSIILVLILVIGGVLLYRNIFVENVVYNQGEVVVANNIEYLVNKVYLTNKDKNNRELDTNYIIVDFSFFNRNENNVSIDLSKTRLIIKDDYYYPIVNRYDSFSDIGVGYNNQIIKPQVTYKNYILVFKVNKNVSISESIYLELFDNEIYKDNELKIKYQKMLLAPSAFSNNETKNFKINEVISFSDSFLERGSLKLINYELDNSFIHEYQECLLDVCNNYKKVIQSDKYFPILKINYEIEDITFDKLNDYITLIAINETDDSELEVNLELLEQNNDVIFYELGNNLRNYELSKLKINIHGSIYLIDLK